MRQTDKTKIPAVFQLWEGLSGFERLMKPLEHACEDDSALDAAVEHAVGRAIEKTGLLAFRH
jgi:hypothetical protein